MATKFQDQVVKDLPTGNHKPCKLESVKWSEPGEKQLLKYPDMKPSFCFRFVLHDPDSDLDGHSAVRFCNETASKLGALYQFATDLNGGDEPEEFDPDTYVGKWFGIRVKKCQNSDKLRVVSADPITAPAWAKDARPEESNGADTTDEDADGIPF